MPGPQLSLCPSLNGTCERPVSQYRSAFVNAIKLNECYYSVQNCHFGQLAVVLLTDFLYGLASVCFFVQQWEALHSYSSQFMHLDQLLLILDFSKENRLQPHPHAIIRKICVKLLCCYVSSFKVQWNPPPGHKRYCFVVTVSEIFC